MISRRAVLVSSLGALATLGCETPQAPKRDEATSTSREIRGALWFDGVAFRPRTGYVVADRFSFQRPGRVEEVLDLNGAYLVPPYADAHNHGIGTGVDVRDRGMIAAYLNAGVFYMQSQGNLPLSRVEQSRLGLNRPGGLDAIFAQGSITGTGGHPMGIIRDRVLPGGYLPGHTLDTLRDLRFYEVASEAELRNKWPAILASEPDFIKFFLYASDEYTSRRDDPAFFGRRGLDPAVAPTVVQLAHTVGLRASAHVVNVADFRAALDSGVDVIAHVPTEGVLSRADAQHAAQRRVVVTTTCAFLARLARSAPAETIAERQRLSLTVLRDAGVHIAIGSDDPADPTPGEVDHLRLLNVFGEAELLALWTDATARAIFPERRLGRLEEGYEASFLALGGDPLADWSNTQSIRMRFKQGHILST